ncbi:hypothetical protein ACFQLX_13715 [Streptomyces polyrhachis]|uniref:Uncharacterized protein n=1 Tax=Streptomyces polyrhachis TaxID=1282885 RepID=A0ABW2GJ83_9ACTN
MKGRRARAGPVRACSDGADRAAILGAWDGKRLAAKVTGTLLQRTFAVEAPP